MHDVGIYDYVSLRATYKLLAVAVDATPVARVARASVLSRTFTDTFSEVAVISFFLF